MKVRVKICGLTRKEDVQAAVDSGADSVGFIHGFPSSPRNLTANQLATLLATPPTGVETVVVTKADSNQEIQSISKEFTPAALQLYGDLTRIQGLTRSPRIIGVIRIANSAVPSLAGVENVDSILLDSKSGESFGGTGKTHDWSVSRKVRDQLSPKPIILSGGLNPQNVTDAIKAVQPSAVDASSRLESAPGKKDAARIQQFIHAARSLELGD